MSNQNNKKEVDSSLLELNYSNLSVLVEGEKEIILTNLEFKIFELFIRHPNRVLTYENIHNSIWGTEDGEKQYRLSNIICHIRKKIEKHSKQPEYIKTIRSRGYMLVLTNDS